MKTYEQNWALFGPLQGTSRGPVARALDALLGWRERARSRRHLMALNDYMLRDIGIDRTAALSEGEKPFWRR
jgi:uncharacterized protein YjiS (DUF1127 family)